MTGTLFLSQDPSAALEAATKNYVDGKLLSVTSFNTRQGAVTLLGSDVESALGYTPINRSGDTSVGSLAMASGSTLGLGTFDDISEDNLTFGLTLSDIGKTWINSTSLQIKYWDGTAVKALGIAGSYLTGL